MAGTETDYQSDPSMSFSSVSIRGDAVYRCRPEAGFGLCRHEGGQTIPLGDYPSIAPPIIAGEHVLVSCLDGRLVAVPLEPGRRAVRVCDAVWTAHHGPARRGQSVKSSSAAKMVTCTSWVRAATLRFPLNHLISRACEARSRVDCRTNSTIGQRIMATRPIRTARNRG